MSSNNNEQKVTSSHDNNENSNSDDDFDDRSMLKFYLKPGHSNTSTSSPRSQKDFFHSKDKTESKPENVQKKLEHLTYLDFKKSITDDSKYIIHHPLTNTLPIYHHPSFEKYNLKEQVKLICSYHSKVIESIDKQARLQVQCVPYPLIIKSSSKLSTSSNEVDDKSKIDAFDALINSQTEQYVSRSGRMTKRKFYSEQSDLDLKKPKVSDDEWSAFGKQSSPVKSNRSKSLYDETDDSDENKPNISKKNLRIMSKSSLFKDKDPPKTGRMAKIAENLELKIEKDEEEVAKIEKFQESLNSDGNIPEILDVKEEVTWRRVIPPPVRARTAKTRKQKEQNEAIELPIQQIKPDVSSKPQCSKTNNEKRLGQKRTDDPSGSQSGTKRQNRKMVCCPICSRDFKSEEIEDHAATCGENIIETRSSSGRSLTCMICDEVLMDDNEYEKHMNKCSGGSSLR